MPRNRLSEFYCTLVPRYQRHDHSTDKTIIDLFNAGLSNADISKIVESLYGATYSKQTVSNITDKCFDTIEAFKNRPLSKEYAAVCTDATCMSLRRDITAKEAVHLAIGITVDGSKEILGYEIAPNESYEV